MNICDFYNIIFQWFISLPLWLKLIIILVLGIIYIFLSDIFISKKSS
jgi:hypothetical protein